MKRTKILILLITLSFPVLLYLFLRAFGENEFALPVYFDDGQDKVTCENEQVDVNDIYLQKNEGKDTISLLSAYSSDFKIVHIPDVEDEEIQTLKNELNRVLNTFEDLSLDIISLIPSRSASVREQFLQKERGSTYTFEASLKPLLVNCIYAFPTSDWNGEHPSELDLEPFETLVLLDEENKIRGFYNGYETKEVDRLILEIRVLLSNK